MKKILMLSIAAAAAFIITGCGTHNVNMNYKGLDTVNGKAIAHVNTTRVGCHLFGVWPIFYDASYTNTFNEFVLETRRLNGNKVNVVDSTSDKLYAACPPFTWILTPVRTSISGDVFY